jgi:hypothetical protein
VPWWHRVIRAVLVVIALIGLAPTGQQPSG